VVNKTNYKEVTVCQSDHTGLETGYDMMVLDVMYIVGYSRLFIHIAQISSLATACAVQPLLTFWSHIEQTWILR